MKTMIAIAIGGALGSVLRFFLASQVQSFVRISFPLGIFIVNVFGCFLIGFLGSLFIDKLNLVPIVRAAILIGFLGGFTTFSTFTNDAINLFESGETMTSCLYIFLSLFVCLFATWFGILLGRSH